MNKIKLLLFLVAISYAGNISSNAYYDKLGYPKQISIPAVRGNIQYTYSASGEKLRAYYNWRTGYSLDPVENTKNPPAVSTLASLTRDYVGNKIYEDGELKKILLPNGYIENNIYYFYLRDHLGNNMVTAQAGGTEIQLLLYHPYGSVIESLSTGIATQPYKFGGKEEENMHGVGLLDFHNRSLDPITGRFTQVDPLAEVRPWESVYLAMGGNPVRFTDPTGKSPWDFILGAAHSFTSNFSLGTAPTNTDGVSDAGDYNAGRDVGDVLSAIGGAVETLVGGAATAAGSAVTVTTAGGISPVSVPLAAGGVAVTAHGAAATGMAAASLMTQEGRLPEKGITKGEGSLRNKPKESGIPNSSEIQSRNPKTKQIEKYTTFDDNGNMIKEYRGAGKDHGNIPRPNVKEPKVNTNPKTGESFQNGYNVRPARLDEIPKKP